MNVQPCAGRRRADFMDKPWKNDKKGLGGGGSELKVQMRGNVRVNLSNAL